MLRRVGEDSAKDDHYRQYFQCMTIDKDMYKGPYISYKQNTRDKVQNQRQRKEYCPSAISIKRAVG